MEKIIIANWKLNPETENEAVELAKAEDFQNILIAPPFPFLKSVLNIVKKSEIAAQDIFWEEKGPYTGEVSASQLKAIGVDYAIVGHSEKRALGDTDEIVNKKIRAGLEAHLKIILCVGEKWEVREKGNAEAKKFIELQIKSGLKGIENFSADNLIIAYEPVWAIGTGQSDEHASAAEIIKFIKEDIYSNFNVKVKVLYGGSVNSNNFESFLEEDEIDGALVGGASLKPDEFRKIIGF